MVRKPYVKRCHECRRRKIKCGGEDPACQRCIEDHRDCPGYQRDLDIVLVGAPKPRPSRAGQAKAKRAHAESSTLLQPRRDEDVKSQPSGTESVVLSPRVVPRWTHSEARSDESPDESSPVVRFSTPFYGQPSYEGIEAIARRSFLRDIWVPPMKLSQSVANPSFSASAYVDRFPHLVLAEADKPDATMLRNCLNAASISIMGGGPTNLNAMIKGQVAYHKTLQSLRKTSSKLLYQQNSRDRDLCLLTCFACSFYGMIVDMPFDLLGSHIFGIEVLIKHCGLDRLETPISREVFLDIRCLNLSMSILSFKALWPFTQPIKVPSWWDQYPPAHSPFQQLVNACSGIPDLFERFSQLRQDPAKQEDTAASMLKESKEQLLIVNEWHAQFKGTKALARLENTIPAKWQIPSKPAPLQPFPLVYSYDTYQGAVTLSYFTAITIALIEHMIEVHSYLADGCVDSARISLHSQSVKLADIVCQSMEFFFAPAQRFIGRISVTFPFPMAHRAYSSAMNVADDVAARSENSLNRERLEDRLEWCQMAKGQLNDLIPTWDSDSWKAWMA